MKTRTIRDGGGLGENLRDVRIRQNITQLELAQKLEGKISNNTQNFISKIETGLRRIQATEIMDLAEALGVSPEELLVRTESGSENID